MRASFHHLDFVQLKKKFMRDWQRSKCMYIYRDDSLNVMEGCMSYICTYIISVLESGLRTIFLQGCISVLEALSGF